jgi:hypothetical protein
VSIAQQIATPDPPVRTRRPVAPLQTALGTHRSYALVRILGLVTLTALGAALVAGSLGIVVMMLASGA